MALPSGVTAERSSRLRKKKALTAAFAAFLLVPLFTVPGKASEVAHMAGDTPSGAGEAKSISTSPGAGEANATSTPSGAGEAKSISTSPGAGEANATSTPSGAGEAKSISTSPGAGETKAGAPGASSGAPGTGSGAPATSPAPPSQAPPAETPKPRRILRPTAVRRLPGKLDETLMFNSNSPEIVKSDGILLSALPPIGRSNRAAHLDMPLSGRFKIFFHHINNRQAASDPMTLFVALLAYNPDRKPATVRIRRAASYLSRPDAPFVSLPAILDNEAGNVYAGPGDRVTLDFLRDEARQWWQKKVVIPARGYALMADLPIPVRRLTPALNGRTLLMEAQSKKRIYLASLAMFGKSADNPYEAPPELDDWIKLSIEGDIAAEREKAATPPGQPGPIIYGRVSGVQKGSQWKAAVIDPELEDGKHKKGRLLVPPPDTFLSFPIATVAGGTFGTQQVQSAPLLVRYDGTAYEAHGNYGVKYDLTFPLFNDTNEMRTVEMIMETPVKTDKALESLTFFDQPPSRAHFRGTVKLTYRDDRGKRVQQYWHLLQQQGQPGPALVTLRLKPRSKRNIRLTLFYPPDATPPQVVTLRSSR